MHKRFLVALLAVVLAGVLIPGLASAQAPDYITQWGGTRGSGNGQFNVPSGVAVDGSGNVYVELPRFSGRLRTAVDRRPHEALFRLASP
jgi:hypothetical protein